jgi:hypothetical protein
MKLSRRTILQGAGVALALPWLESLAPSAARAQSAARTRYIALYFPNGTAHFWTPRGQGAGGDWQLSPILEPLAPMKQYVSVLGNVANYSPFGGHVEPSHSNLGASTWTCIRPSGDGNNDNAISIDQVIANKIGGQTTLASIQVGLSTLDSSTDGLPGQHSRSMAWKSANEPLYKLVNPQAVFDRLTSGPLGPGTPVDDTAAMRRRMLKKSVLDYVIDNTIRLQPRLGAGDRQKLDQYLTSVRALEKRVGESGMQVATACEPLPRPDATYSLGNVPPDYNRGAHATLMTDLIVMALQCDITRVVSYMLDDARSDFVYDFIKEREFTDEGSIQKDNNVGGYHGLQHAGDRSNGFATIGWWMASQANDIASKLAAIDDGDGANVLDNTVITFCSGMNGGNHDAGNIPIALIGGGGKTGSGTVLKRDQHFAFGSEQALADVHLTVANHVFGCDLDSFGASDGVIEDLLA